MEEKTVQRVAVERHSQQPQPGWGGALGSLSGSSGGFNVMPVSEGALNR